MDTGEIRTPRASILSIKIDSYIDSIVERAAKKYGFESKSDFLRYIICAILLDLGELKEEDEYLCYRRMKLGKNIRYGDDDPDMLVALANTVAAIRGLEPEKALELVVSYSDLLEALA